MAFKLNDLTTNRESKLRRNETTVLFLYVFLSLSLSLSLLIKSYIKCHYSTYGDTELKHLDLI